MAPVILLLPNRDTLSVPVTEKSIHCAVEPNGGAQVKADWVTNTLFFPRNFQSCFVQVQANYVMQKMHGGESIQMATLNMRPKVW